MVIVAITAVVVFGGCDPVSALGGKFFYGAAEEVRLLPRSSLLPVTVHPILERTRSLPLSRESGRHTRVYVSN